MIITLKLSPKSFSLSLDYKILLLLLGESWFLSLVGLTDRFKQVLECFTYWCMSNFLPGYESPTEEEQLRAIWNEVNVGATGFLDRHELSVVCDHIGMDSMNEQV